MRIAQVVTYVSADGAFGGPVSVALAQSEELARRGHDVDFISGWDGKAKVEAPGVNTNLFSVRRVARLGMSGVFSLRLLRYLRKNLGRYDVVHVHLGRDLLTLPAASLGRRSSRLVVQTHGMVMPDGRLSARVLDRLATTPVLGRAAATLVLSPAESEGVEQVSRGSSQVVQIANGVSYRPNWRSERPARAVQPEILFLARLHPRKRVTAFVEAARLLIAEGIAATFHIVGPDEGDLGQLTAFIDKWNLRELVTYEGAVPAGEARARLSQADVYVLPSRGEVFPMTVLEAMSVGTPVVLTHDCAISEDLSRSNAAVISDESPDALANSIRLLLEDASLYETVRENAAAEVERRYSISRVADRLEQIYSSPASPRG
jgi:glycosyltransferase involved in cell wall biosynthesis